MSVRLTAAQLDAKFRQMGASAQQKLMQALIQAALYVERDAKINCPVAPIRGGTLRRSIIHRPVNIQGKPSVQVAATAEYAIWVHDGTSKMPARPFLMDAYNKNKSKMANVINKAIREIMQGG